MGFSNIGNTGLSNIENTGLSNIENTGLSNIGNMEIFNIENTGLSDLWNMRISYIGNTGIHQGSTGIAPRGSARVLRIGSLPYLKICPLLMILQFVKPKGTQQLLSALEWKPRSSF